jgi:hypothetical protein
MVKKIKDLLSLISISFQINNLDYSRTDMRGAADEAEEIYRESVATKKIGSPLG